MDWAGWMARPSLLVMAGAALLDYLIGDPPQWLHPVQVMGWGIERYSQWVWARQWPPSREKLAGVGLVVLTVGLTVGATLGCLLIARRVSSVLAVVLETVWVASALAGRSLRRAALEVLEPLQAGDLAQARQALSQYVGRDTAQLPEAEILRAVLETVTENATDGVMAPLFYALVGAAVGPSPAVWALAYKAVSTLDSMVGYRSPPYTHLGWASARLEDGLTWLPCRLVVVTIALLSGRPRYVWRVCCRDAPYDPSPNAGWSECCYAAALGVQMGGVNVYRGVVKVKPKLGDPGRPITPAVVHQALTLNRWCFLTWLALGLLGMLPR